MKIVGMSQTIQPDETEVTTLHVTEEFDSYFSNPEKGRKCSGLKVNSIYVGRYDCSALKVGMEIEIYYDRAVTSQKGTYQAVKKIEILSK